MGHHPPPRLPAADWGMTQPAEEDRSAPQDHDTRPDGTDPRRTPEDNRFGYGSDGYEIAEGNDPAVTDTETEAPETGGS